MGFFDQILGFFKKKRNAEALQSASNDFKALQSDTEALQERFKAQEINEMPEEPSNIDGFQSSSSLETPKAIELNKDSLQLGIAAGYTGKSLKEIESSLIRIETQMASKDWFLSNFEDRSPEIIDLLRRHEQNEESRFEVIQNLLIPLNSTAERAPEPLKTQLITQIRSIEHQLPLTPKMKEALLIIKEAKEISYKDLSQKMNWNEISGLRGLLTNMIKRTSDMERFERDGQGWVKYVGS